MIFVDFRQLLSIFADFFLLCPFFRFFFNFVDFADFYSFWHFFTDFIIFLWFLGFIHQGLVTGGPRKLKIRNERRLRDFM